MQSYFHPLRLTLGGLVIGMALYLGFSFWLGILGALGGDGTAFWRKDWPLVLAGATWIVLFSSGVVGCLVNLVTALSLPSVKRCIEDFDELRSISKTEYKELDQWLRLHTYELEHLREMWGEDHD